jgi:anti-anti-sigma factor
MSASAKEFAMSFHFVSHSWEVTNVHDGIMVRLGQQELDPHASAVLVDELFELVRESGQPNLYLDLADVHFLASVVEGKLSALGAMLRKMDCKLILCNVDPLVYQYLQTTPLMEQLDVRCSCPETVKN